MTEWLLAFDAGCGVCGEAAGRIGGVVDDRLTLVGLGEERVRALRRTALGGEPPFAPTLLAVDGERVRAWTGPALSARLCRLLGPVGSLRVVRALNRTDVLVHGDRRRLLKAVPGLALGAFLVSGGLAAPAMASAGRRMTAAGAEEWAAGLTRIPTGYREVTALPMPQRRAVYARIPDRAKAGLWLEHVQRYRAAHPELSGPRTAMLEKVAAAVPAVFAGTGAWSASDVERLREESVAVLGPDVSFAALGVLGPAESPAPAAPAASAGSRARNRVLMNCDCHKGASGCSSCGNSVPCTEQASGCGWLWQQRCDGVCGG
ncbi:bacteriocin fulvocin C-related protein [Streptomyces sp. NPDC052496]|uniref:bacteriocin fulvocin C-related protein n=1 Tax=Streptomyces sp. NPDC052496 TaxID=3154951 RepID=UPI00342B2A9F